MGSINLWSRCVFVFVSVSCKFARDTSIKQARAWLVVDAGVVALRSQM